MSKRNVISLLFVPVLLLGGVVWWFTAHVHSLSALSKKALIHPAMKSSDEFCEYHSTLLRQAIALENPDASIAANASRAVLEKWKQQFLVQEQIDDVAFQHNVRIVNVYDYPPNESAAILVNYVLLRDWHVVSIEVEVQEDGTYTTQHINNPAYRVQAELSDLSCEEALSLAGENPYVNFTVQDDDFLLRSAGEQCGSDLQTYTITTLSLISGKKIFSQTEKKVECSHAL